MSKETNKSFETNFKKLETLAEELQNNDISIDELIPRMKEALSSVKVCKEVLKETKSQLKEIETAFTDIQEN